MPRRLYNVGDIAERHQRTGRRLNRELLQPRQIVAFCVGQHHAHFEFGVVFVEDLHALTVVCGAQLAAEGVRRQTQTATRGREREDQLILAVRQIVEHVRYAGITFQHAREFFGAGFDRLEVRAAQHQRDVGLTVVRTAFDADVQLLDVCGLMDLVAPGFRKHGGFDSAGFRERIRRRNRQVLNAGLTFAIELREVLLRRPAVEIRAAELLVGLAQRVFQLCDERVFFAVVRGGAELDVRFDRLEVEPGDEVDADVLRRNQADAAHHRADGGAQRYAGFVDRGARQRHESVIEKVRECGVEPGAQFRRRRFAPHLFERSPQVAGQDEEALDEGRRDDAEEDRRQREDRGPHLAAEEHQRDERGERRQR